jgi:hypothetical protein
MSNSVRISGAIEALSKTLQIYYGSQLYWWWKPEYIDKTTNLSQVTDKL